MRFISDAMLGKLTRWLRMLGQDVSCINDLDVSADKEDDIILDVSKEESRVILTKDEGLHNRALKKNLDSVLLKSGRSVADHLKRITDSKGVVFNKDMDDSRCSVCNGELEEVDKSIVENSVPDGVLEDNRRFWKCRNCDKIYWLGSHWENIEDTLSEYESMR
ncbi:MAG: DUF5615 family PIN-like protein [Candidatus Hadarchaeia archaeon]